MTTLYLLMALYPLSIGGGICFAEERASIVHIGVFTDIDGSRVSCDLPSADFADCPKWDGSGNFPVDEAALIKKAADFLVQADFKEGHWMMVNFSVQKVWDARLKDEWVVVMTMMGKEAQKTRYINVVILLNGKIVLPDAR